MCFTPLIKLVLCLYDLLKYLLKMGNEKSVNAYVFKLYAYEKVTPAKGRKTPLPRSGHRIVCDTKNLYSFGGYNPLITDDEDEDEVNVNSFPLFQELWKFNFASRRWKRYSGRQSLPQELASNAVIREGNYLMVYACVYGGTGSPFGYRCSNQVYICHLNDEQGQMFEIYTTGQQPMPQYGQALVYHNNHLYTIGGTTGFAYTCDIHRLNISKKVWESVYICQGQLDCEPEGRYRHEVAFDGKTIYILGGGTADDAFDFLKIPSFNTETRQWNQLKTKPDPKSLISAYYGSGYPAARRCHGAVQIECDNDIHVFITGGYDGELVFDDLWRLEVSKMQWTLIEKCVLPRPIYFHSAAVSPEGKMYVFGGIYTEGEISRSNDIYSVWIRIPKLSEICWEALLHYNPQIMNCAKDKLMDIGLPKGFLERLE